MAARMTCSTNRVQAIAATMAPIVFLVSATQGDADHPEAGRGDHRVQAVVLAYETGLFDPDARPPANRHEGPAR
jgi:hypothetical protein